MASKFSSFSTATRLVHVGRDSKKYGGLVHPPTFRGSTIQFADFDEYADHTIARRYATQGTPGTDYLEELLLSVEGLDDGCAVFQPSGLSAISVVLLGLVKAGDHILISDGVYSPTRKLCDQRIAKFGVEVEYYPPRIMPEDMARLIKPNTRILYMESPSSNSFEIQNVPELTALARKNGVATVLDNTWSAGYYFKAFKHEVDFVIYAMTKYQLGHSHGLMGAVLCQNRNKARLKKMQQLFGLCCGSHEVEQALIGMRTMEIRLKRHQESTLRVATWLENHDDVSSVQFPVLPSSQDHAMWKKDFSGGAGPFAFCLDGKEIKPVRRFFDTLQLIKMGYSWAGVTSLMVPVDPNESRVCSRYEHNGTMFRLHVGMEDPEDIMADLDAGFKAYRNGS